MCMTKNGHNCRLIFHRVGWETMKQIDDYFKNEYNDTIGRVCIDLQRQRRKPWLAQETDYKNRLWKLMYQQCEADF